MHYDERGARPQSPAYGEQEVRSDARVETRFHSGAGITSWCRGSVCPERQRRVKSRRRAMAPPYLRRAFGGRVGVINTKVGLTPLSRLRRYRHVPLLPQDANRASDPLVYRFG